MAETSRRPSDALDARDASPSGDASGGPRRGTVVTIDGAAGTGKSTIARMLAERLRLDHLDTGAMYRAAALLALEAGIDPDDGPALAAALRASPVDFDWSAVPPVVRLGGRPVEERVRDLDVSGVVSRVAARPEVRAALVEQQRSIGRERPGLVSEGRDQGSVVFPDALVRFFLHADETVRAARRVAQLRGSGRTVDEDAVLEDIRRRDRIDTTRSADPLSCPPGAIVIDTAEATPDEIVERMAGEVERRIAAEAGGR